MDAQLPDDFDPHRGARVAQVIEHHHHGGNGNGNAKLNSIILALAAFGLSTLMGIALWQLNRVMDKQDTLTESQAQTNERLVKVETKVDMIAREQQR